LSGFIASVGEAIDEPGDMATEPFFDLAFLCSARFRNASQGVAATRFSAALGTIDRLTMAAPNR
jgi:hypothetical protein